MTNWFTYKRPTWEIYLENASEDVIRRTGLSREELKHVLDVLHEERVIN
jgi:hypothetical protein